MLAAVSRVLDAGTAAFYRHAAQTLRLADVPFLVGGAYALQQQAGIERHTKDFDLFLREADCPRALAALAAAGYRTEMTFSHWLGKVFSHEDAFVDLIFSSGNGIARVDDDWFRHAVPAEVFGLHVDLCAAEEMIWSKGFVQERERFDGADIAHLLRAHGRRLDWPRLLRRYGSHGRILLGHLILFGYIYPGEREAVPTWVLETLWAQVRAEQTEKPASRRLCRGTLLSREQYLVDLEEWGYEDARLEPEGALSPEEIRRWTEAIDK
jgi:hypothetical protein